MQGLCRVVCWAEASGTSIQLLPLLCPNLSDLKCNIPVKPVYLDKQYILTSIYQELYSVDIRPLCDSSCWESFVTGLVSTIWFVAMQHIPEHRKVCKRQVKKSSKLCKNKFNFGLYNRPQRWGRLSSTCKITSMDQEKGYCPKVYFPKGYFPTKVYFPKP